MQDFQDTLKRIIEADDPAAAADITPQEAPIGAPDKFNIGHHRGHMDKASDPGEVLRRHLEAQAFEFKKLKAAYDELVAAVEQAMGDMRSYGIEDKGFMKGKMKPMMKPQGAVSDPSTAQAMAGANQFRQSLNNPITANVDDI